MKLIGLGLAITVAMLAWSIVIVSKERPKQKFSYPGWNASVGLALGNLVIALELIALIMCKKPYAPFFAIIGVIIFSYCLVWGSHFIQIPHADQIDFEQLITGQLVYSVCFLLIIVAAIISKICCSKKNNETPSSV
tara:strand:- start:311 stop:718 length:408 start_codon:yes stop_codon:yes gene_type:complete